ncbi:hypothetical protein [Pseudomonas phage LKA1]|uniref:dATP/dGTP diphosphohydrolase N-terminal domain-containing protein n=1 Tax=Pseudomonas phage LKA1 TaxID=386793 RepID=Q0E5X9_9CAUD|nr:hypothetical protein AV952_gp36 [Pseudomonas phage LKA1]CAK25003.1 hypothetical protein [Pseudomonas phage LKA1]
MPSYPIEYTYESERYFYRIPSKLGRGYGYDYWSKEGSAWVGGYGTPVEPPLVGGERSDAAFKADTGKSRWTLLLDCARGCGRAVRAVVRVLNFAVRPIADGGKGYIPHSWRQVPDARTRYEDALHRHLDAIRDGETHDGESGESHWAHVATNALFLWELDNPKEKTDE